MVATIQVVGPLGRWERWSPRSGKRIKVLTLDFFYFSCRAFSSFRLHSLGLLCLWQCLLSNVEMKFLILRIKLPCIDSSLNLIHTICFTALAFFEEFTSTDQFPYLKAVCRQRLTETVVWVRSTARRALAQIQTGFNADDSPFLCIQFLILVCDIIPLYI